MKELVVSGRIFELIAGLLLLEGLAISLYRSSTGRGIAHLDLWFSLGAGAGLLLAARAMAVNAGWIWVALSLLLALAAHAGDLRRRWRNG
jgi:hypothetical protein